MRKLLIFGNGLGRSIDNDFYDLGKALDYAWNDAKVLESAQKKLIWQCLPSGVLDDHAGDFAPKSENELDRLQQVLAACDEITKHEVDGGESWLTENGKKFPGAIRSYVHAAASYFHSGSYRLPEGFSNNLRSV